VLNVSSLNTFNNLDGITSPVSSSTSCIKFVCFARCFIVSTPIFFADSTFIISSSVVINLFGFLTILSRYGRVNSNKSTHWSSKLSFE
jgi:hypothetical protein